MQDVFMSLKVATVLCTNVC